MATLQKAVTVTVNAMLNSRMEMMNKNEDRNVYGVKVGLESSAF